MHELTVEDTQGTDYKAALACKLEQSDRSVSLEELWQNIEQHVNPRLLRSLTHLTATLRAPGSVKCTFNRESLTAKVEMQFEEQVFLPIQLRAYDALHLNVPELCAGRRISFELRISPDSLVLSETSGLSAVVIALRGRFRCPIFHLCAESDAQDGDVIQIQAANPLTGEVNDSTGLIVMRGSMNPQETTITEQLRTEQISKRRTNAKKLRRTYSGLQAISANPIKSATQSGLIQKWLSKLGLKWG